MVVHVRRPWLYAVTVLFLISLIAPTVRLTSAQGEATPTAVEEVAPAPTDSPPPPEPTALPTDPPALPTEQTAVAGPTLAPTTEPLPTETAPVSPEPTVAPTSEPADLPTPSPDAVVDASTGQQSQQRIAPAAADPTLRFEITTNDGGNPDGIYVDIIERGVGTVASVTIDSMGVASATIPFGTYSYSTYDPNGIYGQVIQSFDFTSDGQVVAISLETTLPHGSVTFTATTSDGGAATQSWINVESLDTGNWYGGVLFGEDNTASVVRLPYGLYRYHIAPAGVYQGSTGDFTMDDPLEAVNVSISALPNGTITLDGSTSDGGSAQGAYVELLDEQGYWVASGYLDENHDVTFPQILFGTYTYNVSPYDIYEGATGTIDLAADSATATFTLQAKPLSTLTVNVTTSDGGTAEGASIQLIDSNGYSAGWGTIDANNQSTIERLVQGEYSWTIPQWDVYGEATGVINLDSVGVSLDVTLQAQPTGTVTFDGSTDDGQQPEGAYLALRTADGGYVRDVQLDGNLDAVLERIPYGSYTYYAGDSNNVYPQVSGSFTLDGPELTVNFALSAVASGVITLDGTTSDGRSANGVWFSIRTADWTWSQGGNLDDAGDATLPRLPLGDYVLSLSDNNGRYEPLEIAFTSDQETQTVLFELVALPGGTLTVTVHAAGTENPVAGASIIIRDSESWAEVATGVTGEDGTFATADQLTAGNYAVDTIRDGYYPASDWVLLAGNTDMTVSLEPRVPGVLTIEVREQGADPGVAIAGASVVVRANDNWEIVATGTTGDDGTVTTASLTGGDYYVEVSQSAYYGNSAWVRVNGDTSTTVLLEPRVAGILTVAVMESGVDPGHPVEGANVTISYWDEASSQTTVVATGATDAAGIFTTSTLEGRDYDILVSADGYFTGWTGVRVNSDTSTTVLLEPRVAGILTVNVIQSGTAPSLPVEGAAVTVSYWDETTLQTIIAASGTTGADGIFITSTLEGRDYDIQVVAENYYAGGVGVRVNGDTATTVSLEPRLPGALTVEVLDQRDSSPVAEATVVVRENSTYEIVATGTTGLDGTFITATLVGGDYYVEATADTYFTGGTGVRINGDTVTPIILEPRIPGTLTVTVIDQATNDPVGGVSITVRSAETGQTITNGITDTSGVYTSGNLAGDTYFVDAEAAGYFSGGIGVRISGDTSTTVYLQPRIAGTLTVTVVEPGGTVPVPDATVTVRSQDTWEVVATGATDVDGEFATSAALTGGYYEVLVEKDNYYSNSIGTFVNGDTSIGIELTPRIPGTITITVLDGSTGNPIPNADVWASSWDARTGVIGTTNTDGIFITSVVTGGQYDIFASADGYYTRVANATVSGDTSITISLPPRIDGTLTVHVTDRITGDPIEEATVSLQSHETWLIDPVGTTGPEGTFSAPLAAGSYYIVVTADGYFGIDEWSVFIDGDTGQDIALSPKVGGSLTVLATHADTGDPIPGASVTITSVDEPWQIIGTTGADGAFTTFDVVDGGNYRIVVAADGYFAYQGGKGGYYVVDGDTEFSVRMYPAVPASITFTIDDALNATPLENASIVMTPVDGGTSIDGSTDANGRFTTNEALPGGLYDVSITADGYYPQEWDRWSIDASDREIHLWLQPKLPGEIHMTVLRSITFEPIEGAIVTVWSGDNPYGAPLLTGSTDASGVFRSGELPADQVWYQVEKDGYIATGLWSYRLWESVREDTIFLVPADDMRTGTVVVQDAVTGDPIEGAEVVVTCGKCDGGYRPYQGLTDASGQYAVANVAAARYMATVSADGYEDTYAFFYTLELNLITSDATLVVELLPLSYIPDAHVALAIQPGVDGTYLLTSPAGARFEGSIMDGLADIGTVPFGRGYSLTVTGNGYEPVTRSIDIQTDEIVVQTTLTTLATPTAEPSVTPVTPSPSPSVTVVPSETPVTPSPSPSVTPSTTPSETPSPSPSTTPVTPDPSPSVTPSVTPSTTPVETTTPTASETPVTPSPSVTVTPSETPVTPEPSETAVVTPEPSILQISDFSFSCADTSFSLSYAVSEPVYLHVHYSYGLVKGIAYTGLIDGTGIVTSRDSFNESGAIPEFVQVLISYEGEWVTFVDRFDITDCDGTGEPTDPTIPAETSTPETPTVTPVTPGVTPSPSPSVTPAPGQDVPLETSFTLCANPECTPPHNTGADGFTASWTVTEQTDTAVMAEQAKIASIGGGSATVSLSALQQDAPQSWTITAVIKDGVATGFSEPLPLGGYRVCLNPVLTGPDGSTIVLPDVPPCDAVQLTEEGAVVDGEDTGAGEPVPFSAVIIGAPEVIPPAQEPPGEDGETPTATPPTSGETPASGDQASGSDSGTSGTTSTAVSGLPNTGSGGGQSPLAAWLMAMGASAMAATAIGIRRRNRT